MKFSYTVKDSNGKLAEDTIEASSKDVLIEQLQNQGYFILNIRESAETKAASPRTRQTKVKRPGTVFTRKKIKLDDLLLLCRQLGTMLESGVPLLRSLEVIAPHVESKELSEVLTSVKQSVEQGTSFSASLAKHPKVFNQFWVSLMEVGEASGTMPQVLEKLAYYLEQDAAFRSTILSAVIYPLILFVVAIGAVFFFAFFVGPKFESIFDSFGVELPVITKVLLNVFHFIKSKFLLLVAGICAILFLIRGYIRTPHGRLQFENMLFNLPIFGRSVKLIVIERYTSQMAILIESGVPILFALDIAQRLVGNRTCELIIRDVKERVKEGELLAKSMSNSDFFPPMAIQMIMVGEETGELSKMLEYVAGFYQRTVETFMKRFATMIEPFMLIFMGVVIGTIVLAMFLPMFNISRLGGAGG